MPLSVIVFIGLIMLAGIVVNNAIVLIDRINQRRDAGLGVEAAILEAAGTRLRPILMTTLTTVLGLAPLIMAGEGNGDAFMTVSGLVVGGALAHNLGIASSGAGTTAAGRTVVVVGLLVSLGYAAAITYRRKAASTGA